MSYSCFSQSNPVNSDDENTPPLSPTTIPTGKPDFSVITQTLSRQFQNVASFLAPPPQHPYSPSSAASPPPPLRSGDASGNDSPSSYDGIKNDLAAISDSLKTGLSLLSPKKAVNEISKFASNLLQFDKGVYDNVGITDTVLDFVREISVRPECWLDFPLSLQNTEFNMSEVHKDHMLSIQQLVPNLTTLRHSVDINEQHFWMIYFILLLPRLNEDDYQLLFTPQIIQVREVLLQKLRNKNTPEQSEKQLDKTVEESSSEGDDDRNKIKKKNDEEEESSSASDNSDWVRIAGTAKANRSSFRERLSESGESGGWHAVEDVDL